MIAGMCLGRAYPRPACGMPSDYNQDKRRADSKSSQFMRGNRSGWNVRIAKHACVTAYLGIFHASDPIFVAMILCSLLLCVESFKSYTML